MFKKLQIGSIINAQAYKHNGLLYRQWNGIRVLEINPEMLVLFLLKTKVIEETGQKWIVREPMLWFFPIHEWFNTSVTIRKSDMHFYTNLASQPIFEDNTIKFIDYDLDIKFSPGQSAKLIDKNDFKKNTCKYNYPPKLIQIVEHTVKQILKMVQYSEGCFNTKIVWSYVKNLIDAKQISTKKFI